jgi:hypothetical protein
MSGLAFPLALLGLITVPLLIAIYLLRLRSRRHPVSSLFLWHGLHLTHAGGRRLRRLERSLLLLLEVVVLCLLAVAAAGPWRLQSLISTRLVVVLDDSFSMQAVSGTGSARDRAAAALTRNLGGGAFRRVLWLRAGRRAELLGESSQPAALPPEIGRRWQCTAPAADLGRALELAFEIGGKQARVLVLSDQPPPPELEPGSGRIRWLASGRAAGNVAIVAAVRSAAGGTDRCLIEVANLADAPATVPVTIAPAAAATLPVLELAPGEHRRLIFSLPQSAAGGAVLCRLPEDALGLDNQALLLPSRQAPLQVANEISDPGLRRLVQRAVDATGHTVTARDRPELVISDRGERSPSGDEWVVRLLAEPDAAAYVGPFVLQHSHPLCAGLSLEGVVWAAGRSRSSPGEPVITAGNVVLVSDSPDRRGRHLIRMRWRPEHSTLQLTPDWPILVANLVAWRRLDLPGPEHSNLRLGESVTVNLPPGSEQLQVEAPDGERRAAAVIDHRAVVEATRPGRYQLYAGDTTYELAVHAAAAEESDLRQSASGSWGSWQEESALGSGRRSLAWLAALLALAAAVLHQALWLRRSPA